MFLFVIGLEMQPSRLWSLRREIFGLGAAQVLVCGGAADHRRHRSPAFRRPSPSSPAWASCCPRPRSSCRSSNERGDNADAGRPAHHVDPAARRPRDRAAAGDRRLARAGCRRRPTRSRAGWRSRSRSPRSPRLIAAGRWLLNPMFRLLAAARGARGDDGGGAARRARRGARHADRRPVDGDGRVPRRRAACRNRPSAISSRPTSSRSAASCSACSSSASACRSTSASIATDWPLILALASPPSWRCKGGGIYVVARLLQRRPRRGADRARR